MSVKFYFEAFFSYSFDEDNFVSALESNDIDFWTEGSYKFFFNTEEERDAAYNIYISQK